MSSKPFDLSSLNARPALLFGLLGALAVAPYRHLLHTGVNDEGIVIQTARRMLAGEIPYRDFDLFYTPGSMVATAAWLAVFGPSIEAARWLMMVCAGVMVALIFLISRRLLAAPMCYLPPVFFAISGYSEWPILSYHWFAILGLLACADQLLAWQADKAMSSLLLSGVGCGLAAICLQSEGVASMLAATCVIGLMAKRSWPQKARDWALFVAGVLLVWGPFLLLLLAAGALPAFVDNTIIRVLNNLYHSHAAPYDIAKHVVANWAQLADQIPSDWTYPRVLWLAESVITISVWTLKYLLLFPVIGCTVWLGFRRRGATMTMALFLVWWTFMMRERLDLLYSNYLMPLWYVALAVCLSALLGRAERLGQALLIGLLVLYGLSIPVALRYTASFAHPARTSAGILWSNSRAKADAYTQLYAVAANLTPPGSRTFAWPFAASFYVLSQTENPSRLDFLVSGWQGVAQARTAADSLSSVDYLYLFPLDPSLFRDYPNIDPDTFQRESREHQAVLTKDFEPFAKAGSATVFRRRGLAAPTTKTD